ncbi:MAG: hypothetical protein JNM00_10335, partial [Flavobacteriales bacterium]|nr:hypothetical protein [Flavobacteriales bacterium]
MRKLLFALLFGLTLNAGTRAQINLIGVSNNIETGNIDLLQWTAFDPMTVTATPTTLDAYLFATSAFDPFNSNYYITGISGLTTGLYSYNSENGESNLTTGSLYTNIAEFDMST